MLFKIGLRNKGIDWAIKNHNPHKIYSVAILHENEIPNTLPFQPLFSIHSNSVLSITTTFKTTNPKDCSKFHVPMPAETWI